MALHFLIGNSGSGKTYTLHQTILQQAKKDPRRMFYVVVPEQFTMQTQKELVLRQPEQAIMNVDVVSFDRLAYRIFDELGKGSLSVLEDTGKNLVLRKLAEDHKNSLTALKQNISRMGYIDQMKSLISEFMQYGLTPKDLEDELLALSKNGALYYKLKDMLLLYREFDRYLKDRFVTSETLLSVLADCVGESELLKGAVFAFDCFTGFTPVQMNLMRELMKVSGEFYVTACMDIQGELYNDRGIQELFYMSRKMVRSLTGMAGRLGITIEQPKLLDGRLGRFSKNQVLGFLEEHLFRPGYYVMEHAPEERDRCPALSVYSLASPKEELIFAAAKIRELLECYNYRYQDIAIVSGCADVYEKYAKEVFETSGIPYFSDEKENVLFHPFTEWVRAALWMVEKDFSYESVFRYLRTGLSGFEPDEIDVVENYVLERGIRGFRRWKEKWVHLPGTKTSVLKSQEDGLQKLCKLNSFRERFVTQIMDFRTALKGRKRTVRSMSEALYQLMLSLHMQEQLKEKQEQFEAEGQEVQAAVYAQIYRVVIDLLDKIVDLLGEETTTVREYADILDAGFTAAKIGTIPPGADCVILGDIERTRLDRVKVVIFLGLNDGVVPKQADRGSLLSQYDRELLADRNIELASTAREQVFLQKFYLYLNMTKPSDALIMTCGRMDSLGNARKPSYLVGAICRMFPFLQVQELTPEDSDRYLTAGDVMKQYVKGLILAREGQITGEWKGFHHWLLAQPVWADQTRRLFDAAFACFDGEGLNTETAKRLYGTTLQTSVSRFESFARCAYAHFLEYGLKLKERPEFTFETADMGNVFHGALECYSRKVKNENLSWFDITKEQQKRLLKEAVTETVLSMDTSVLEDSSRGRYMIERIHKILERSVWALTAQIRRGVFHPGEYETLFRRELELSQGQERLNEQEKIIIRGRIDRIDTFENEDQIYLKVLDYKSGKKKFQLLNLYYGLQLQLMTYMNEALAGERKKTPDKDVIPAGVLYYHLENPMVELSAQASSEDIEKAVLEELRPEGLINQDPAVIEKLDKDLEGKSRVIPVTLKKDGTLSSRGCSVASRDQFEKLGRFTEAKIKESARQILKGEISPKPVVLNDQDGCQYCPFAGVCQFDLRIPGYEKKQLENLAEEEIWRRMDEEETEWK
ncbi:ATP-dependent helicase/deoxyribonuclease subunit B [uncultured Roseburia sp.]|uniref:Helicase-exonuclease AddAB subunit AddB n=1 Tax=Brotonthovivens ammoniilytica TaxID=2981725 RepID=A0ABT2TPF5_9FIRM|nr:helicase-exonuclease AddAB subunit AddB [Brotonthovivens ammoniilytica]MCU6763661.1 helicase-exonuclease AddAB subunit AddB [Brotonthovivens ammoniilytica]SCJ29785.1 ATP-dependent helicase/deoxyribonuclease subunit B [uncultured Roseburia sp.]